jgi:hypothetical protein
MTKSHRSWTQTSARTNTGSLESNRSDKATWKVNVTRTVTNIANGVQISETTSDPTALAKLNERFTKAQAKTPTNPNPLVTVTRTQLSNGIQTTITSTDAATVTKIQSNGGNFGKRGGGKHKGR